MGENRSKQTIINSVFGVISSAVSLVSAYVVRICIFRILGDEIYGINNIFYSIVNTMLILELGISSAIVIFLYKPMALKDDEKIKSIVRLYRDIYRILCLILFLGGCVCCVALPIFVHTKINMLKVRTYFLLYLVAIILKYLWSYKKCLLFASQKNRIVTAVTAGSELLFCGVSAFIILYLKDYFMYLCSFILQNVVSNAICNIYVNKKYPFIVEKNVCKLSKEEKKGIVDVCRPLFVQRISNQVNNSSSSLVLGTFANVVLVGFYSNYLIMVHAAQTVVSQISNSFTSSFGNYMVYDSSFEEKDKIYRTSRMGIRAISMIGSCFFVGIADYVVCILFGKGCMLDFDIVVLIGVYLYLTLISSIDLSVQNAIGKHKLDVREMIIQTVITIVFSIVMGWFWDLRGIIVGNIIPYLFFSFYYKNYAVRKHVFHVNTKSILFQLMIELLQFTVALICIIVSKTWIEQLLIPFYAHASLMAVVSLAESIIVFFAFNKNTETFSNLLKRICMAK